MKKLAVVISVVLSLCLVAGFAFAAETKKGTIKAVDDKAGTITFCAEGTTKDEKLKVDKAVDLKNVKVNTKVNITVDKDTVKEIKPEAKPKAATGC